MVDYFRVVLVGSQRRVTMVLPYSAPLGSAVPTIVGLVDEPSDQVPIGLLDAEGRLLDISCSPEELGILDGAVLRLVSEFDAPAPPEVVDIASEVVAVSEPESTVWQQHDGLTFGAITASIALFVTLLIVPTHVAWLAPTVATLGASAFYLSRGERYVAVARIGKVLTYGAIPAFALTSRVPASLESLTGVEYRVLAFCISLFGAWCVVPLYRNRITMQRVGALLGVIVFSLALLLLWAAVPRVNVATIVVLVATTLLVISPSIALSASGLLRLESRLTESEVVSRDKVSNALAGAYGLLDVSTLALSLACALSVTVLMEAGTLWTLGIAACVLLITLLRSRLFRLRSHVLFLRAAAVGSALIGGVMAQMPAVLIVILILLMSGGALAQFTGWSELQLVRWRRTGDAIEQLAALALVPLAVGSFGLYSDLLGAFG